MRTQPIALLILALILIGALLFVTVFSSDGGEGNLQPQNGDSRDPASGLNSPGGVGAAGSVADLSGASERTNVSMSTAEGRVLNAAGEGVPGAEIWFGEDPFPSSNSDASGYFSIPEWALNAQQSLALGVYAEGYLPYLGESQPGGTWQVTLDAGGVLELQALDSMGVPLHGRVSLSLRCGNTVRDLETDNNGFMRTGGWPLQPVAISWSGVPLGVSDELKADEAVSVEVRLPRFEAGTVNGIVVAGGQPLAGVKIHREHGVFPIEPVVTDAKGMFTMPVVSRGRTILVAESAELAPAARKVNDRNRDGEPMRFELVPGRNIPGQVLTRGDKVPIAGAEVRIRIPVPFQGEELNSRGEVPRFTWARVLESGDDGRFESGVVPLENIVVFNARKGQRQSVAENRHAGDATEVALWIDIGIEVVGRVVDPAGRPVTNAHLTVRRNYTEYRMGYNRNHWYVDAKGDFHIYVKRKFGDKFWIAASAPGYLAAGQRIKNAIAGDQTEITITLQPGTAGSITGRLLDSAGQPVHKARVRARSTSRDELWGTKTDPFGRFRFRTIQPGGYELFVDDPEEGKDMEPVRVSTDVSGVELRLPGPRIMSGRLIAAAGMDDGMIEADGLAFWQGKEKFFWVSHPEGKFEFYAPPPGTRFWMLINPNELAPFVAGPFTAPADGSTEEITVQIQQGRQINGRILEPDGIALKTESVRIWAIGEYKSIFLNQTNWDLKVEREPNSLAFNLPQVPTDADLLLEVRVRGPEGEWYKGTVRSETIGTTYIEVPLELEGPSGDQVGRMTEFELNGLRELDYLGLPDY